MSDRESRSWLPVATGRPCFTDSGTDVVDEKSERFGQCLRKVSFADDYRGLKLAGAKGLDGKMEWWMDGEKHDGTLLEYFAWCGAELDEEQKGRLQAAGKSE